MQDFSAACAFVAALTGLPADHAIVDVRMLHDSDKTVVGIPRRGVFTDLWAEICAWNNRGYGCFINVNEMDGVGRELPNVAQCRAHIVDLDNVNAPMNYERAAAWVVPPNFAVQSSPGKFHVYWKVSPYKDIERYTTTQRKLRKLFDGDKVIIDASRILRIPGTLHCKNPSAPHIVVCWALPGYANTYDVTTLEQALADIQLDVTEPGGLRHELGDPALAAPSVEWLTHALMSHNPNDLERGEWISLTSAFKQAGWSLMHEHELRAIWDKWCASYDKNDVGENDKQWKSIRQTQVGWPSLLRRAPGVAAQMSWGGVNNPPPVPAAPPPPMQQVAQPQSNEPVFGDILDARDQQIYFKDHFFVTRLGEILAPSGMFLNSTKFNGNRGGKMFVINSEGKMTDEAWKAATRSTLWTIPKVDDIRFMPDKPFGHIEVNSLGHKGVNTYRAPNIIRTPGDISPFLNHVAMMLPNPNDQRILYEWIAHNVKFPGHKIPWAPLIQSAEGTGKGLLLKAVLTYMLGQFYIHSPKAKELVASGSQFNAWMRNKLMIIVDEIRTDERRDMIEVLKPWITDPTIEVQGKGQDQVTEDNCANWLFFSNYKDAIPISENSRRFSIFYSALQNANDLVNAGMTTKYFNDLSTWLDGGGNAAVAHWFWHYPIERGGIEARAPETSSHTEVLRHSRGPVEHAILDAVEDGLAGFRGGYVSIIAAAKRVREATGRAVATKTIATILETYGYTRLGRAERAYWSEDANNRSEIYGRLPSLPLGGYGAAQGYPETQ